VTAGWSAKDRLITTTASPNYRTDGPRVRFDLEGYDLLLWDPA
jgi:hypothetical protein